MFEGSEHYDKGYFQPLQQAGGLLNGSTNPDRTNYWEVVPTGALELALWMESDRMGYLLPALTKEKFENQRDVVLNERRQNYENRPYGLAGVALAAALFAPDHPYHWLTIGSADDLRAMSLDEVREFFATYYHPANASLSLAGDIDAGTRASSSPSTTSARFRRVTRPRRSPPTAALEQRRAPRARRSRRAAAPVSRLALAGDVRRATMRSSISRPTCSRTARPRASTARSSTRSRSRPTSSPISTRARSPACFRLRRPRRPASPLGELERVIVETLGELGVDGADGSGARTRARADRRAVRLSPADDWRLRRQVRSAERLQRVSRRSRVISPRTAPATSSATPAVDRRRRPPLDCSTAVTSRSASCRAASEQLALPGSARGPGLVSRVDRAALPAAGPSAPFRFPRIHRRVLSNGLEVRAISHRNVPVVSRRAARAGRHGGRSGRSPGAGGLHRRPARRGQRRTLGARGLGCPRASAAPISTSTSAPMRSSCR